MKNERTNSVLSIGVLGVLAICALLVTGCATSLNHVGAFSQASADLAKRAAEAYNKVNDTTIERRIASIAADPNTSPGAETFDKLIASSDLAVRLSLLKGIEKYASALGELASADFRKKIDTAAKDLYGALGELQETYASATGSSLPLSNESLAIISTAVDAIGTSIAESKRRSALKTVVIQSDPSVQKALSLAGNELPEFQEYVWANLNTVETEMLEAYEKEAADISYDERVERLRKIYAFHETKAATAQVLVDLGIAGKKIGLAHAALVKAVERDKFTSPDLVKQIKEVVSLAQSFKEYYDKLIED